MKAKQQAIIVPLTTSLRHTVLKGILEAVEYLPASVKRSGLSFTVPNLSLETRKQAASLSFRQQEKVEKSLR